MNEQQKHDIHIWYEMASMEWSLNNIKSVGFEPRHIVDVGAYKGEWTTMAKRIFPHADVLMIEAQRSKKVFLEKVCANHLGKVKYRNCLLGAASETSVPFYELETGSSVLPEQSNVDRQIVCYPMLTLDEVVKEAGRKIDLLKLDVQGYELQVLKGGLAALKDTEVVLMETSLLSINKGAPLLSEVVEFMKQHNFVAYDICSLMRRPLDNALCQTDFLFVKDTSALIQSQQYGR